MTWRSLRLAGGLIIVIAVGGPMVALLVIGGSIGWVTIRRRTQTRQERRRLQAGLPTALDLLVLATDAGLTPHQTMRLLSASGPPELRPIFATVVRRTERGESLADALEEIPRRIGPAAVAATDALAIAQRHGAPLRPVLLVITAEAARQRRAHADAAARRLPVLLSFPLVCCILPAFLLLAIVPAVLGALADVTTTGW